jgi:hypothetical protein
MKEIIIFLIIFLITFSFAQNIPVIENRSKVIAKVRGVILRDFPNGELILEILESMNIEGYKNFAKKGDVIIANFIPREPSLYLCYFLKPKDEILAILEFVGDERKRMWMIRDVEKREKIEEKDIEEILRYYLFTKGLIDKDGRFYYKIIENKEVYKIEIKIDDRIINIYMDYLGRIKE